MAFFPTDVSKLIKRLAKIEKDEIDFTRKYANEKMTEKRMETWLKMMNKGENIRDEMIRHSFFADVYEGVEERCHYTDMHQLGMILMNAYTMDRIEKEVHGEEPDEDLFYAAASLIQNAMTEMEGEEDDDEDWDDDDWDEEEECEEGEDPV